MGHTKGPWLIKQQPKKAIWVIAADGFHIAEVNKYAATHGDKKDVDNAYLLAAAPEILEQLVLAHRMLLQTDWAHEDEAMGAITAAIAKAKGTL